MTLIEAEAICQSLQVTVSGSQHPKPLQYFEHAPFPGNATLCAVRTQESLPLYRNLCDYSASFLVDYRTTSSFIVLLTFTFKVQRFIRPLTLTLWLIVSFSALNVLALI